MTDAATQATRSELHGVRGRIDLNVFHGSEEDWHRWVAGTQG